MDGWSQQGPHRMQQHRWLLFVKAKPRSGTTWGRWRLLVNMQKAEQRLGRKLSTWAWLGACLLPGWGREVCAGSTCWHQLADRCALRRDRRGGAAASEGQRLATAQCAALAEDPLPLFPEIAPASALQRLLAVKQETRRYAGAFTAVIEDAAAATIGCVHHRHGTENKAARMAGGVKVHQEPGSLCVCPQLRVVVSRTSRSLR